MGSTKRTAAIAAGLCLLLGGVTGGLLRGPASTPSAGASAHEREAQDSPGALDVQHDRAMAYPRHTLTLADLRRARRAAAGVPRHLTPRDFAPGARSSRSIRAVISSTAAWQPVGPAGAPVDPRVQEDEGVLPIVSGRVSALALSPTCQPGACRMWLGAAGGGVWRTDDALAAHVTWTEVDNGLGSESIGSLVIDPTDPTHRTIYAGTGEGNFSSSSQAGIGLYRSVDAGDTWSLVRGSLAIGYGRAITGVVVDPADPAHLWMSTSLALRGSVGSQLFWNPDTAAAGVYESTDAGASFKLDFSPDSDGVVGLVADPTQHDTLYAATVHLGVFRSAPAIDGDPAFHQIFFAGDARSAVAVASHSRLWITSGVGADSQNQGEVYRVDNADRPFAEVKANQVSSPANGASGFCEYQCFYDQTIAVDPAHPDTAWIGGQVSTEEAVHGQSNGRVVLRTLDGGATWTDMTTAAVQEDRGTHADMHALLLDPDDPNIAFMGSDGGIIRTSGTFASGLAGGPEHRPCTTDLCHQLLSSIPASFVDMNDGLSTLQFLRIAVPNDRSGDVQGGTQDNGTDLYSGARAAWLQTVEGDSATAAVDATDPKLRVGGQFFNKPELSHHGGAPHTWFNIYRGLGKGFQVMPLIADPVVHGTLWAGARTLYRATDVQHWKAKHDTRHRWRSVGFRGDWTLSAIGRSPSNRHTVWVGTGAGELGVSQNANARRPGDVRFARVTSAQLPGRYISAIVVDPGHRDHAWVSYVGFASGTPTKPGHVLSLWYHERSRTTTVTDVSNGIGDQPVDDLALDPIRRDLYASTDYGVIRRVHGATTWSVAAPGLPTTAVFSIVVSPKRGLLYAGTHGRGLYALKLGT